MSCAGEIRYVLYMQTCPGNLIHRYTEKPVRWNAEKWGRVFD